MKYLSPSEESSTAVTAVPSSLMPRTSRRRTGSPSEAMSLPWPRREPKTVSWEVFLSMTSRPPTWWSEPGISKLPSHSIPPKLQMTPVEKEGPMVVVLDSVPGVR